LGVAVIDAASVFSGTQEVHQLAKDSHGEGSLLKLEEWLKAQPGERRLEHVLDTAIQILDIFSSWHGQRSIYGRLNPQRIQVRRSSTLIELDCEPTIAWDTAGNLDSRKIAEAIYLAPEQTGALARDSSPATDLYSLGLVLYRLLTDRDPFEATSLGDLLHLQMTWMPGSLRMRGVAIPRALDELVLRLVRRDPADRYQSADAVRFDCQRILDQVRGGLAFSDSPIGTKDSRSQLCRPSFLGRQEWLENFLYRLESDLRIAHDPWLIRSAPGQGKSALLDEFANESLSRRMITLRAYGKRGDHRSPLAAIRGILNELKLACQSCHQLTRHLSAALDPHRDALRSILDWLWPDLQEGGAAVEDGPESFAGQRFKQALAALLDALSHSPVRVVVLIDDLDFCDEISKDLWWDWIHAQASNANRRTIFVATHTDEFHDRIVDRRWIFSESMGSMSDEELRRLVQSMAGNFPSAATQLLINAAQGNPYVLISLIQSMVQANHVVAGPNGWQVRELALATLDHSVPGRSDFAFKLEDLSPGTRRILTAAAILGKSCSLAEVGMLAQLPVADVQQAGELAVQKQLAWCDFSRQRLGFLQEDVRQRLLQDLSSCESQALHAQAAAMIEGIDPDRCYELADHYDLAQDPQAAVLHSLRAAKLSRRQYSSRLAIHFYQMALRHLPVEERAIRLESVEALAEIYLSIGEYDAAEHALGEALQVADSPLAKTRLRGKLGDVEFKRGRMQRAVSAYTQAFGLTGCVIPSSTLTMLGELTRQAAIQLWHTLFGRPSQRWLADELHRLRWSLYSRLAHTFWFSRGSLWTLYAHLKGMNEAECFLDSPELAKAYSEHGPVCSLLGWFRRAEEYSQRSLKIREADNDLWGKGQTLSYLSVVHLAATRFEECVRVAGQAVQLLERTGDAWETNMAKYQGACALMRLGRYREAAELASSMYRNGLQIGDIQAAGISLDILMRTAPGWLTASMIQEQAELERSDAQSHAQTQLARALWLMRESNYQEAATILEEAIRRCRKAGSINSYISPCYAWLSTARRMMTMTVARYDQASYRRWLKATARAAAKACRLADKYQADRAHALRERGWSKLLNGESRAALRDFRESIAAARRSAEAMEEWQSLRAICEIEQSLGKRRFPVSEAERTRWHFLQQQLADSIGLIDARQHQATSMSLVDRFDKLLDDGRRIARSLSRESILKEVCLGAQHLIRGQEVFWFEKHSDKAQWSVIHGLAADDTPLSSQVDTAQAAILDETIHDGEVRFYSSKAGVGLIRGSLIVAPVRMQDKIVACLVITHREVENLFGINEAKLLEFIAAIAGAALENSEGFEKLRDINLSLEQRVSDRTEELRKAMAIALAASQAKSRFMATMSHEVRTPLNGILGMARLALMHCQDSRQINYLGTIQRSGESLLSLLNDLLDFSKLEAGKMTVEMIPFDPRQMLGDVLSLVAAPAWNKGIELVANFATELPEQVLGDGIRLRQIVMNLIGNAVKFTAGGSIEIRVDVLNAATADPQWRIAVIDTGIGIPKHKQAQIFEAFSQVDATTTRRFGGTGLGLSISAELVKLMEGTIAVQSQEGVGSCFSVTLPLRPVNETATQAVHACNLSGMRILILEPLTVARQSLERLLESWGATTVAFEAWRESADRRFVDWELFDLAIVSGEDSQQLMCDAAGRLPIWRVLAPDDASEADMPTLTKPLLPVHLVNHLFNVRAGVAWVAPTQTVRQPEETLGTAGKPAEEGPGLKPATGFQVLVADDGEVNRLVLVGFLDYLGVSCVEAKDGKEAVTAIAENRFDLCLMDIDMPELDGIEATRLIRKQGYPLKIVAMTAHHDEHYIKLCEEAGMNGYLTKPIQADQLACLIKELTTAAKKPVLPADNA
jgi:signal transduction histidine kinase/CheY-like chemotaxis protein/tetratricopeptide (TPR) repeat protein